MRSYAFLVDLHVTYSCGLYHYRLIGREASRTVQPLHMLFGRVCCVTYKQIPQINRDCGMDQLSSWHLLVTRKWKLQLFVSVQLYPLNRK